jgi:hypothetical protein
VESFHNLHASPRWTRGGTNRTIQENPYLRHRPGERGAGVGRICKNLQLSRFAQAGAFVYLGELYQLESGGVAQAGAGDPGGGGYYSILGGTAMMDYETIKAVAKEAGVRVGDLCALAPNNDPFYTGRPSEVKAARWFADLWRRFGYTRGVHLRRVHYQIVSQDPVVLRPDGTPYENTERCWDYLCSAGKWARYLDLVDAAAFKDKRNPEPTLHAT